MKRNEILNYLGTEVAKLLEQYRSEACMLGENPVDKITYISNENTIVVHEITGEELYYSLSEIQYIFTDNNSSFNMIGINFEEGFNLAKREADLEYGQVSKNLFINYIGSIIYSQYKCHDIYNKILDLQAQINSL